MAIDDLVRKMVQEELKRMIPEVFNNLYQRLESKMDEKLEHAIPQILHQIENIMHQQANGVIAHTSQLPRSVPTEDVQQASDLQLVFTKKLLLPIFSEDAIKYDDHNHLQVALMQIKHGQSSVFSLRSPIEIEIVVLDGGFPRENSQDWNTDEFNSSILEKRENKRSLLLGESKAPLHQGIASFGALKLTDNSSWVKTGKFRLGVRVSPGSYAGPRIKEAITESFRVLDHRSKPNQKSHPPSLDHEVWRLVNIGRNGALHRRLEDAGIKTVQDFLNRSVVDRQRLRDIIKMSDKKWEETIRHAETGRGGDDLERVPEMPTMIGAQKQNSIKNCELESYEPSCSNPPDGSQRELSAGNVTPGLGAAACVLEQLPSQQRAGAGNQNRNPSDSIGGIMEAQQQQQDHFGDQGGPAALWSPTSAWPQRGSPHLCCGTGEYSDDMDIGGIWL